MWTDINCFNSSIRSHSLLSSRNYSVCVIICSRACAKNTGLDKRYHRAQCRLNLFLGAESDPDSAKHKRRNRREGEKEEKDGEGGI